MPKYQITVPDGRQVMVDAANANDAAEAADTWSNQGRTPAQIKAYADAQTRSQGAPGIEKAIGNGFSFNTGGDLDALLAAGETGVHNFVAHATGQPDSGYGMAEARQAVSDVERNARNSFAAAHPVQNLVGSTIGALANPLNRAAGSFVADAGSIPMAMVRSGVTGAGLGAAYGAGGADPGQRGKAATTGAVVGGVLGAAAPPILAGAGALLRAGKDAAGNVISGAKNLISPPDPEALAGATDSQAAMSRLADVARAAKIDIPTLTDQTGLDQTTAQALGRTGVTHLGALVRQSGTTGDAAEPVLRQQIQDAPGHILNAFSKVSGLQPEEAAGDMQALTDRLRGEANPLWNSVRAQQGPVWSPELAKLAERPVIKTAIQSAADDMLNAGKDPTAIGLKLDPDTGLYALNGDLSTATDNYPTAETWDLVRQRIGDQVERHPLTNRVLPDSQSRGNFRINQAKTDLTNILAGDPAHGQPGLIPGYRAALDKSGDYLSLNSAFERGQDTFLNKSIRAADFAKTYNGLSEPDQKAWLAGVGDKLAAKVENGELTPRQLLLPGVRNKLAAMLGDDQANTFLEQVGSVAKMTQTANRMMPGVNSPTSEFMNAGAEQGAPMKTAGLLYRGLRHPGALLLDLHDAGVSRLQSPQYRNELGRLLLQSPEDTAAEFGAFTPPLKTGVMPPRLPYPAISAMAGSYAAQRK